MAFIQTDSTLDPGTTEGRRAQLRRLLSARTPEGGSPRGDIEVLEPEFIEYTDDGVLVVKIPVRQWQLNGVDNVQGGILTYMIDCIFGVLSFVTSGCSPVGTVDMTTNYLRPIPAKDDQVTVRAQILTNSRRVMHAKAELFNGAGKVAVTASTNIMKLQAPKEQKS